jgi:hypothetical protein
MGSLWTQKVALNGRHPSHLSVAAQKIALQGTHHIKKAFPNGNAIIPQNKSGGPRAAASRYDSIYRSGSKATTSKCSNIQF